MYSVLLIYSLKLNLFDLLLQEYEFRKIISIVLSSLQNLSFSGIVLPVEDMGPILGKLCLDNTSPAKSVWGSNHDIFSTTIGF